jgi:tRNA/rRNA methyltransferase
MDLRNIRVVLVRTIYGGNLGSVCRAMKNMGLSDLALVDPGKDLDFFEAHKMALHAQDVLEGRRQFATLAEAVADCALVAGTSARPGLYRSHSKSPREWAPRLLESAATKPVAIVFGTEDDGLSNEELALSTQIIRIPSTHQYASVNLAQAVMICCYELFVASGNFEPPRERYEEATLTQRERMLEKWRQMLWDIGFFDEIKADHMMMAVRRIFSRGTLTEADANILMGVAQQAMWLAEQWRKATGAARPAGAGPREATHPRPLRSREGIART